MLNPTQDNPSGSEFLLGDMYRLLKWLRDAEMSHPETYFRKDSMEDYRFYAGNQDTEDVKAALANQKRPRSTYNEVKPKIDMLVGLAAQTKHEPAITPVGVEDEALAQIMQGVVKHLRTKIKMTRKELECFEHTVKSGRSLLHFYIDKSNPFQPEIKAKRFPGRHFYLDPQSQEYDMSDARFLFLETWLPEAEIKARWKNFDISRYQGFTFGNAVDLPIFFNEARNLYRIMECWYFDVIEVAWFVNPLNGKVENLLPKDFKVFATALKTGLAIGPNGEKKTFPVPEIVLGTKKQYKYKIFSGTFVIEEGISPYKFDGFPSVLYGAYKDEDTNAWFSVIKMMKDPQRASNTMKRQLQHLLQTLPKGILAHEVGAITNIEEYEKKSADPSFHLEVITGGMEKFKFVQQPAISPIYNTFGQECSQSMKDASGIQNEMMGVQTTSREPGVTVRARQETNLAVLYSLYDNFRESRMAGTKILMNLIQQYMAQPMVIRIEGQEGAGLLQVNSQINPDLEGFNDITAGEFDLVCDENIESSTSRAATMQILSEFGRNNPGSISPDIVLEFSDVPYSIKQRVKANAEETAKAAQLEKDRAYQLELLKIQQKVDAVATDAAIKSREVEISDKQKELTANAKTQG